MAFDPKCYELAEYFLQGNGAATDEHRRELAQIIQDEIEAWVAPREEYPDNGPTDPHDRAAARRWINGFN